jgi:hypothetical protein
MRFAAVDPVIRTDGELSKKDTNMHASDRKDNLGELNRHVESVSGNVKKHGIPPILISKHHRPVYTAAKVSMAGFTIRGVESEISYTQSQWPRVLVKELGDNAYDSLQEFYRNSPKERRKIAYQVWQPYPELHTAEYSIIRVSVTSSNVDEVTIWKDQEDLQLTFDLKRNYSSKRGQYKGGTGELGDALKRMLKMGYASWVGSRLNEGKTDLQWDEPITLTFNKKRYNALLQVDTEIDEAQVIINQDFSARINDTDTTVSVALPIIDDYENVVYQLKQYYNIYKIPKSRIEFSFTAAATTAKVGDLM